jgi:hypothetical protein
MVWPVSAPQVVAFLEHASKTLPENAGLFGRADLDRLIRSFEYSQGRAFERDIWAPFINRMGAGVGLDPVESYVQDIEQLEMPNPVDPLVRYRDTKNHAIFLYDSMSGELGEWIARHVIALHERSGDTFDIYGFNLGFHFRYMRSRGRKAYKESGQALQHVTRRFLARLSPIPGAQWENLEGLPAVLIWSDAGHAIVLLADIVGDDRRMARFIDHLVQILKRGPVSDLDLDELRVAAAFTNLPSWEPIAVREERADIFVSYRRTDRRLVENVSAGLTDQNLSVWFDKLLKHAELFRTRIRAQIHAARKVLVCWTRDAVHSPWVSLEAEEAQRAGKEVIPLLFDGQRPPGRFQGLHGISLGSSATFDSTHPDFRTFAKSLREELDPS